MLVPDDWILIADEYESDAELIRRLLEGDGRPETVRRYSTAIAAVDALRTSETLPCLIMLDGRPRGMTAIEVLERLRTDERTKAIPIIVLSDDAQEDIVRSMMSAGASSFICKVFDYERMKSDLALTVKYWLDVHCRPRPQDPHRDDRPETLT